MGNPMSRGYLDLNYDLSTSFLSGFLSLSFSFVYGYGKVLGKPIQVLTIYVNNRLVFFFNHGASNDSSLT